MVLLRVRDASLGGVEKRAPHGFRCLWLVSPHGALNRLKDYDNFSLQSIPKDRHIRAGHGSAE